MLAARIETRVDMTQQVVAQVLDLVSRPGLGPGTH